MLPVGLVVTLCHAVSAPEAVRMTFTCSADGSLWPYLEQPAEGDAAAVLVYLHGHYSDEYQGMTRETYNDAFGRLRDECTRRDWAYVTAWYGGNSWMGPLAEAGLADLIGVLRERYPNRPLYLCGASMGGSSTLIFCARRPELVDGAIALCPAGDIERYYAFAQPSADPTLQSIANAIRIHYSAGHRALEGELAARSAVRHAEALTMPLYILHGTADALIPIEGARALRDRLLALEADLCYEEIQDGGHDAPVTQIQWEPALDFISSGG